jgi:hypothetical protein
MSKTQMAMIAVAAGSFGLALFLLCALPTHAGSVSTPGAGASATTPGGEGPEHASDTICMPYHDARRCERLGKGRWLIRLRHSF